MDKCKTKAIQTGIIQEIIQAYLEPCVTLAYLEPWHIQNPNIYRIRSIFRTQSNIYDEDFYENS